MKISNIIMGCSAWVIIGSIPTYSRDQARPTRPVTRSVQTKVIVKNKTAADPAQQDPKMDAPKAATNPQDVVRTLIQEAEKYLQKDQFVSAISCYDTAFLLAVRKEDKEKISSSLEMAKKRQNECKQRKAYQEKIQALEAKARSGNAQAAFELGQLFLKDKNIDRVIEMWNLATNHKHKEAPYRLAVMFEQGGVVPTDSAKAEHYYYKGAENGHPICLYVTACLYEIRSQHEADAASAQALRQKALENKKKAAEVGYAVAAMDLALMSIQKQDYDHAKSYMQQAAKTAKPTDVIKVQIKQMAQCLEKLIERMIAPAA